MGRYRSLLSLSALQADGTEVGFNGLPIEPGIHLRWSFLTDLGFPLGGFTIYRSMYYGQEFPDWTPWQRVASIKVPETVEEAIGRLKRYPTGELLDHYIEGLAELIQTLQRLVRRSPDSSPMYIRSLGEEGRDTASSLILRALDTLMMASLDPYVARILGLYWIDKTILPHTHVAYKLAGHWEKNDWPERIINDFRDAFTGRIRQGVLDVENLQIRSDRVLAIEPREDSRSHLLLRGSGTLPLRIILPFPVREVRLFMEHYLWEDGEWRRSELGTRRWRVRGTAGSQAVALDLTAEGAQLTVRVHQRGDSFDRLELFEDTDRQTLWVISTIGYRESLGPIGTLSAIAIVGDVDNAILNRFTEKFNLGKEDISVFRSPEPVSFPEILRTRTIPAPPLVNEDGKVPESGSHLEIFCWNRSSLKNPYSPVRIHVRRSREEKVISTMPGLPPSFPVFADPMLLTERGPFLNPRWELLAHWLLASDLEDSVTGVSAVRRYGGELSSDSLYLDGRSFVEVSNHEGIRSLGSSLIIQVRVRPDGGQFFPTLVGNNWRESFWLGLRRSGSGYRVRLWLNGRRFDSSGTIPAGEWSRITVTYDGEYVRFYIDQMTGSNNDRYGLDSEYPAPLGQVRTNTRQVLRIGADWRGDRDHYFFKGRIADVRIWKLIRKVPERYAPSLIAHWPLDGNTRNRKTEAEAWTYGGVRFTDGHPEDRTRQVLQFNGDGFLEVRDLKGVRSLGTALTLQAWVEPGPGQQYPTIVGNNYRRSFWLGLHTDTYQLRFWLNGKVFLSRRGIPAGRWSHVAVSYDGEHVRFYINGKLDAIHPASLGLIQINPSSVLCIGAESGSTPENVLYPFRGKLADVQIWKASLQPLILPIFLSNDRIGFWSLDGTLRDSVTESEALIRGDGASFERGHPDDPERSVLSLAGDAFVEVVDHPELQVLDTEFTLQAKVYPESGQNANTIIGNNWQESFWLGLIPSGEDYRVRLWLNGRRFESVQTIPSRRWSQITVSYDERQIRFYINGRSDPPMEAPLGPIRANSKGRLRIGADWAGDRDGYLFRGKLADIRIWRRALSPAEAERRFSTVPAPASYIDRWVPEGTYGYQVQGIDIFGRVSEWSSYKPVEVFDRFSPPPPSDVGARLLPLTGRITDSMDVLEGNLIELATNIRLPERVTPESLLGYDLQVMRVIDGRTVRQKFEIRDAETDTDQRLRLRVKIPPFVRFLPMRGDRILIEYDFRLKVRWTWTGRQRLFAPRAREFRIYLERGPLQTLAGSVLDVEERGDGRFRVRTDIPFTGEEDTLTDSWCQVGSHQYKVEGSRSAEGRLELDLTYLARPVIAPEAGAHLRVRDPSATPSWNNRLHVEPVRDEPIPEADSARSEPLSDGEYETLRTKEPGPYWLPPLSEGGSMLTLHRIILTTLDLPPVEEPDAFVPAALVALNRSSVPPRWEVFDIVWYEPREEGGTILYIRVDGYSAPLDLMGIRIYTGQEYQIEAEVVPTFATGQGTAEYAIGVTTADDQRRTEDRLGDPERYGNESPVSRPVTVIAVDRRRPPEPQRPVVRIQRSDYYGQSRADISWDPPAGAPEGVRYNLYRAVDTAVFTRDLEQRRLRTGFYTGLDPEEVFSDVPLNDFLAWLGARFPHIVENWQEQLFPPRNSDDWDRVTPIWRAFAEWFYPSLSDDELVALAEREGNETAFGLVNDKPIQGLRHEDVVDGRVRNRYLYRLRTVSPALLPSTGWGPVSRPASPPKVRPPAKPSFSRVEPGDRRVTLFWNLNRESDLQEYRLYRAERGEDLEDLRWWSTEPDPRLVAAIPDPRAKVRSRAVEIIGIQDVTAILGVYPAAHFDPRRDPADQPRAFNLYSESSSFETSISASGSLLRLLSLRRIADGTPVVVVYRDGTGRVLVVDRRDATDLYLRIEGRSLSLEGLVEPEEVKEMLGVYPLETFDYTREPLTDQEAENLFLFPPLPPSEEEWEPGGGEDEVEESWYDRDRNRLEDLAEGRDGVAVVVLYRDREGTVRFLDRRHAPLRGEYRDRGLVGLRDYFYRLVAVDEAGNVSEGSTIVRARPLEITPPPAPRDPTLTVIYDPANGSPSIRLEWTAEPLTSYMIQRFEPGFPVWKQITGWLPEETAQYVDRDVRTGTRYIYRIRAKSPSGLLSKGFGEAPINVDGG